ncbi:MAG: hypothetical protein ACI8PZ_003580 [Myxococcota bacterium]
MWWWAALAGAGTLQGTVKERGSGVPLVCTVTAADASVVTGVDGRFELTVPDGGVAVRVACAEHRALMVDEVVASGETVRVIYRVERGSWAEEVVVYGDSVRDEVARSVWSAQELRRVPGAFGDPVRALQSLPGVARPNGPDGALVVRGAEGLNTQMAIDGVPVPYLFHFFIGRSVVDPALIDEVRFLPGSLPARYGDTTQAVVDVRTVAAPPKPGMHGRVRVDPLDASAVAHGQAGAWELSAAGRYSWVGGLVAAGARLAAAADDRPVWEASWAHPRYLDYHLRARRRHGPDTVSFTAFGARDALILHPARQDADGDGVPEDAPDPGLPYDPDTLVDQWFLRLDARWDHEGDHSSTTRIVAGPDQQHSLLVGLGPLADGPELGRVRGWDVLASRSDTVRLDDARAVDLGARVWARPVVAESYRDVVSGEEAPTTRGARVSAGAWAEWQQHHGNAWTGIGLRMAAHAFNGQTTVLPEPRVSLRGELSDVWSATWFVGRFSQPPPADRWAEALGNPDLGLMTAWQSSVGVSGTWPSGLGLTVTPYVAALSGVVVERQTWSIDRQDPDNASPRRITAYEDADGRAYGVEALLRLRPQGRFYGWLAATFGRSWRFSAIERFPSDYDQPVVLTAVAALTLPREWGLSTRIRASSGSPFTPQRAVYDAEIDLWAGLSGRRNGARFPVFYQIDLRADKTWTAARARWTLYTDVYNTTNARNPMLVSYTPNFERTVPTVFVPIVPLVGLEVAY